MTTTSYPLDRKAGTNIGKAMTDLQLTANGLRSAPTSWLNSTARFH